MSPDAIERELEELRAVVRAADAFEARKRAERLPFDRTPPVTDEPWWDSEDGGLPDDPDEEV